MSNMNTRILKWFIKKLINRLKFADCISSLENDYF